MDSSRGLAQAVHPPRVSTTSKDDQALMGVLRAVTVELSALQETRNELREHCDRIVGTQPEKDQVERAAGSQFGGVIGEIETSLIALQNTRADIERQVARLRAL